MTDRSPVSTPRPGGADRPDGKSANGRRSPDLHPPILASDALREDVAPIRPWKSALRLWLLCLGIFIAGLGLGMRLGILPSPPHASSFALCAGAAISLAAMIPFPYAIRGALALAAGATLLTMGSLGVGPLHGLLGKDQEVAWQMARAVAATLLPAALLFRARYRAYRGARIALIVGLVLTLPAAVHEVMLVSSGPLQARLAAIVVLVSILSSFLGFMGAGTTAASTAWAVAVLTSFGLEIMARAFWLAHTHEEGLIHLQVGLLFLASCSVTAIGLFHLLASACAPDARRVDVLRKAQPSLPPSPSFPDSSFPDSSFHD